MKKEDRNKPKIALLIPEFSKGFRLESVPLNLAYLGAVLEQEGYLVKGFNLNFEQLTPSIIKEYQIFGISAPTPVFSEAVKLSQRIKAINSQAVIVIGGPHPTVKPEECLKVKTIDYVIVGEGEVALPKLVKVVQGRLKVHEVPNLVYRQGGKIIKNKKELIKNLDQIPFPAKHIFDTSKYPSQQKAYGDIVASRGCPFKCTNCKPGLDSIAPYRLRKPEKVIDEMEWLMKSYGVKHFTFSDSELVGPKIWVERFSREIIKRKLRITYSCNGRTDQVDQEILKLLKKSGCVFIGYGIESGSQEVIDRILLKGIDLKVSEKVIKQTVKSGIGTGIWFMIGIPGETEAQVRKTIDFAKKLDVSIVEINIATPWPGTGFYSLAKRRKWLVTEDWTKMNEKNFVSIETDFLSAERTKQLISEFKNELLLKGWKSDSTQTRFFHPYFLWKTLRTGLRTVLHRGVEKSDFVKFFNWISGNY